MPALYLSAPGTGVEGGWSRHTATLTPILLRPGPQRDVIGVTTDPMKAPSGE